MPNVVRIHGRVHMSFVLMWKIKCRKKGISAVIIIFFSHWRKTIWENSSRPLRSRAFQVNICHVIIYCSSLYASLSNILRSVRTEWC